MPSWQQRTYNKHIQLTTYNKQQSTCNKQQTNMNCVFKYIDTMTQRINEPNLSWPGGMCGALESDASLVDACRVKCKNPFSLRGLPLPYPSPRRLRIYRQATARLQRRDPAFPAVRPRSRSHDIGLSGLACRLGLGATGSDFPDPVPILRPPASGLQYRVSIRSLPISDSKT